MRRLFLELDYLQTTLYTFFSHLFNHVGQLRTSSHLQLRPGQDKAKQAIHFYLAQNNLKHK